MNGNESIKPVLTPREIEVLTLTAYGKTRAEISIILAISEETVKAYIKRICSKLDVSNKTHAAAVAIGSGLITLPRDPPSTSNAA